MPPILALAALAGLAGADAASREKRLNDASRAAWEFMVTREMAGLRDWPKVARLYAIPDDVLRA
ncbi:DUF6665 family protein [Paracoccus sp. (in: a-proteobacteria)]|uniref:DUF6665 family protein n=1 Tax=Paracoccus sp. TaxID=267 RepID=UPI003A875C0E